MNPKLLFQVFEAAPQLSIQFLLCCSLGDCFANWMWMSLKHFLSSDFLCLVHEADP